MGNFKRSQLTAIVGAFLLPLCDLLHHWGYFTWQMRMDTGLARRGEDAAAGARLQPHLHRLLLPPHRQLALQQGVQCLDWVPARADRGAKEESHPSVSS